MSRIFSLRTAAAIGGLAAAATVPAAASAATQPASLAVNQACYVVSPRTRPVITITGAGYAPGDSVSVSDSQGGIDATTTANAAGQIAVAVKAPLPDLSKPGILKDDLSAEDFTATGTEIKGVTSADLTRFDFGDTGTKRAPGLRAFNEKTTWEFSGFPEGHLIYGHYTYDGKLTARQAFGRASGPCGVLTTRRVLYPATPHHKAYEIQVDASSHYSRRTVPSGRLNLALSFF